MNEHVLYWKRWFRLLSKIVWPLDRIENQNFDRKIIWIDIG